MLLKPQQAPRREAAGNRLNRAALPCSCTAGPNFQPTPKQLCASASLPNAVVSARIARHVSSLTRSHSHLAMEGRRSTNMVRHVDTGGSLRSVQRLYVMLS